jgi:uncharacterized membrane protein YvbJ
MICKRCGKPLPSEGYMCKFCGAMMDEEQIKEQKELTKQNINKRPTFISEKYGRKHDIIYNDEENNRDLMKTIFFLIFIFLIVISIIIFLINK